MKLSIVIPTYNRLECLKRNLDMLFPEIDGKSVELIILDNASDDDTMNVISKLSQSGKLYYHRNASNIGPDRNFLKGYQIARGEYVWLLGDDDFILPGTIERILKYLEQSPVAMHLNSCTLKNIRTLTYTTPRMPERGLQIYNNADSFFEDVGIFITFMSAMILRTDLVQAIANPERYIGTYFIQSYMALATMQTKGNFMIDTCNCLAASPNRKLGYDLYYVWGEQYYKLLFEQGRTCGISVTTLEKVYYRDLTTTIYNFILAFRLTSPNANNWDSDYLLRYIRKYPEIYNRFVRAVKWPRVYVLTVLIVKKIGGLFHK